MKNKTCGECLYYDAPFCDYHAMKVASTRKSCDLFDSKEKPPTNGDVIRQGGNQALAEFKGKLSCEVCAYANTDCRAPAGRPSDCKSGVLAWLNAPADCVKQNGDHDTQTDLCKTDNTESEGEDE